MTVCVVYVGNLDGFDWEGDWNGNVPAQLSPDFPPMSGSYNSTFHDWVKANGVTCQQTDFGGWVARVTKSQIADFITETYHVDDMLPWLVPRVIELKRFVSTLQETCTYGLVATEW